VTRRLSGATARTKKPTASFSTTVRVVLSANRWRQRQREAVKRRNEAAEAAAAATRAEAEVVLGINVSTPPSTPPLDQQQNTYVLYSRQLALPH